MEIPEIRKTSKNSTTKRTMPATTPANEAGATDPGVVDQSESAGRQSTVNTGGMHIW